MLNKFVGWDEWRVDGMKIITVYLVTELLDRHKTTGFELPRTSRNHLVVSEKQNMDMCPMVTQEIKLIGTRRNFSLIVTYCNMLLGENTPIMPNYFKRCFLWSIES